MQAVSKGPVQDRWFWYWDLKPHWKKHMTIKKHGDMKVFSKRGKLISHVIYKDGVKLKDVLKKITFKYSGPKNKK